LSFRITRPWGPAAFAPVALAALAVSACSPQAPPPAVGAALPAGPATAAAATHPAEQVEKIHHALLIPGSEVLYSVESAPPTVTAAWASVQEGASKVLQGADQLAQGRAGEDSWTALARQLGEAARASGAASAAGDTDQMRRANDRLAAACTGCHQTFATPKPQP
jgi:hypothetical protein